MDSLYAARNFRWHLTGAHLTQCFFVSDLHGSTDRYEKLFRAVASGSRTGCSSVGIFCPRPSTGPGRKPAMRATL